MKVFENATFYGKKIENMVELEHRLLQNDMLLLMGFSEMQTHLKSGKGEEHENFAVLMEAQSTLLKKRMDLICELIPYLNTLPNFALPIVVEETQYSFTKLVKDSQKLKEGMDSPLANFDMNLN